MYTHCTNTICKRGGNVIMHHHCKKHSKSWFLLLWYIACTWVAKGIEQKNVFSFLHTFWVEWMVFYNNISFLKLKQGDQNFEFPIIGNIRLPDFFQSFIMIWIQFQIRCLPFKWTIVVVYFDQGLGAAHSKCWSK